MESPNREQIRYWNEEAGEKWVRFQDFLDTQIRPLGRKAMDRARLCPGQRVLDIGCGCGDTTLELAQRVSPGGHALGVDISAPMLERARQRALGAGQANAAFLRADAQIHAFAPQHFDVVFSRFGVMFFSDPVRAFSNLRGATRSGGRLAFVCWQALSENPWMAVPLMAALPLLPAPEMPNPDAPGPFAFANPDKVRRILEEAGYESIEFETHRELLSLGGEAPLEQVVDFVLQMGPLGKILRQTAVHLGEQAARAVHEALRPYVTPQGVRMEGTVWIVTARA